MTQETSRCDAYIPLFKMTCGELVIGQPAARVRSACIHEHIREGRLCASHLEEEGGCRACFEVDGHECPITITPLEEVAP